MSWMWHHHHHRERRGPFGPGGPWGPAGPIGPGGPGTFFREGPAAFVRARLHRRIFAWFGISILFTGIALGTLSVFFERTTGSGYHREIERANAFMASQFEKVWDRPAERASLAHDVERDFDVRVELRDASGTPIAPYSEPCKRGFLETKINRGGAPSGSVRVCLDPRPQSPRWGGLVLVIAGCMLWAASGRIARRLARPLGELARVAQDLGRGKLDSRVNMGCYEHGEVGVVAEAMNDMASRIQKQLDDQRQLLATVSHELRTPLSRIRLLTEIARDGGDPAHAFDEIDREVVEIDHLVADLLASSRLDFSALTTKDISAEEAARRAVSRAGLDPDAVVRLATEATVPHLAADPTLLARALANLLDNAAHHAGGAKRVVIRNGGDTVAFEVEDDGPGLAAGEEDRIFELFYQSPGNGDSAPPADSASSSANSESASAPKGALGLGLSLVRRIAEAHGGRAYAENRAEGGARFVLELPVKQPVSDPAPVFV